MGRPIGSKNGHGSNSKPNFNSGTKSFINGRKTSNSSQKSSAVSGGGVSKINGNNDAVPEKCSSSSSFLDRSQNNFPYDIRINGFSSLLNTVKKATSKVKKLIVDECDIILECRVCRSLFRSLPNYLSHKEMYCKNVYNSLADSGYSQFIQSSSNSYEFNYHLDDSLIDSVINSTRCPPLLSNCRISRSNHQQQDLDTVSNGDGSSQSSASTEVEDKKISRLHQIISRIAPVIENATRTPSAFYSDIVMRKNISSGSSTSIASSDKNGQTSSSYTSSTRESKKQVHIKFEPIDSIEPNNGIVFQKKLHYDPSNCCTSSSQDKNKCVIKPDTAVLGPDGKIIMCGESGTIEKIVTRIVAQVDEKHEEQARQLTELNCPHCLTLFPTRKTLRIHVRAAHRNSPEGGDNNNSIPVSTAQNSSSGTSEDALNPTTTTSQNEYRPPAKKYKRFHESTDGRDVRETSPDIVDLKSSQQIVKSSPPKIMRDVQTLFSQTNKRPRGRPKKSSTLLVKDNLMNGNHHFQNTDLSRRLSASDSSEGGTEERHGKVNTKPTTTFRRNLQIPSASGSCEFNCHKCSANFSTKNELTTHLKVNPTCAGVTNLALLQHSRPPEQRKKISILVRHDYLNSNSSSSSQQQQQQHTLTNNLNIRKNNIMNNNNNLLSNPSDKSTLEKFKWPRWQSQDLNTNNTSQKDNNNLLNNSGASPYKYDERHLDITNQNNNTNNNNSSSGNVGLFNNNNNNNNKFSSYPKNYDDDIEENNHDDDLDNEIEEDDDLTAELDEENDERLVEEQNSGDEMIDEGGLVWY